MCVCMYAVFSLGPFGEGGPHVFCIQIPLMWQWVWPKFFDVNSRPHPPLRLHNFLGRTLVCMYVYMYVCTKMYTYVGICNHVDRYDTCTCT